MSKKLPKPECGLGFTAAQLEDFFGDRINDFHRFMRGQTFSLCDGREYDCSVKGYVQTECGPHGAVYYTSDVHNFIAGGPVLDF